MWHLDDPMTKHIKEVHIIISICKWIAAMGIKHMFKCKISFDSVHTLLSWLKNSSISFVHGSWKICTLVQIP